MEGGSRAQPRHGQGDEQASEEQIPAFQATFPRASPGGESDLAASQRPGPTVIYEGFKCLGLLGKQFGAGSFDCGIQSLGTFL